MTTDEKAKAYDEAIKKAKEIKEKIVYSHLSTESCKAVSEYIDTIIPELRESEDERVRKDIVAAVEMYKDFSQGRKSEIYAYLEKQREEEGYEAIPVESTLEYKLGFKAGKESEKQKEQIPYIDFVIKPHKGDDNNPYDMRVSEAQEYAIKRGFGIPFNDGEVYVDERHLTQTIGNILRWADEHPKEQEPWKVGANAYFTPEQKPAEWSEEDDAFLKVAIAICNRYSHKDIADWLKCLPERFNPQPKNGWSEEDEKIISDACCWIAEYAGYLMNKNYGKASMLMGLTEKLKSLRPSWKPSEEQMEALQRAIDACESEWAYQDDELRSLLNDLKKL